MINVLVLACALVLHQAPRRVESAVGDLLPYIPPKPEGTYRCFQVDALVCHRVRLSALRLSVVSSVNNVNMIPQHFPSGPWAQVSSNGDADTNCGEFECQTREDGSKVCKTGAPGEESRFDVRVCASNEQNATSYAQSLVQTALEGTNTRTCQDNYTQLCTLSAGNFTPITDRETGTDRCCRYPRLNQLRQKFWESRAEGSFKAVEVTKYLCDINNLEMDRDKCDNTPSTQGGCQGFTCSPVEYTYTANVAFTELMSRPPKSSVKGELPEPWDGFRINVSSPAGTSIHTIQGFTTANPNAIEAKFRLSPLLSTLDMGCLAAEGLEARELGTCTQPARWNYTIEFAVLEPMPVETSFGEHVMCYDDSDCANIAVALADVATGDSLGVVLAASCCEYS